MYPNVQMGLGAHQTCCSVLLGTLLGLERPGRECYSVPSSAEVDSEWSCTSALQACLLGFEGFKIVNTSG
jgi:hypothetical protein